MKTNKFFSAVFAAIALVGFTSCEPKNPATEVTSVTLNQTALSLEVGGTATLVATVEPAGAATVTWESQNPAIATVVDGVVTGLAEGNTIIVATAGAKTATCIVKVTAAGNTDPGNNGNTPAAQVKGTKIWPIILDGVTAEANASKIAGDLRVDDVQNHLYIWAAGETYVAGEGTGLNFHGNSEGYVALTVAAPAGWSGLGFCIERPESVTAAESLRQAIIANPDKYFLHIGMKATTPGNHQFYTFNSAVTSFAIGTATIEKGPVVGDFTRDGSWAEFDVPMATFVNELAGLPTFETGNNIFCVLSGGAVGSQLNMDAVYFYEK